MSAGELGLELELAGGARVIFTERLHGNLSSSGGDGADRAVAARESLRTRIGVEQLIRGYQEHGTVVRLVTESPATKPAHGEPAGEDRPRADGQATALPGLGMMVLAADCLPVALGCPGAVAMVHAGWRGLCAGVLEEGVTALRELADAQPIVAVIGPGAGVCCYEVGPGVHDAFGGAHRRGRNVDLRAIARDRLLAVGVDRVLDVDACTVCDPRFFSHRREGTRAGRQAGIAWLS